MKVRTLSIVLLISSFAGCAYIDQNLRVAPQLSLGQENIGHGKTVGLRVVDDRNEQLIGKRGAVAAYGGAKISTDQDLAEVLKGAFKDGMRKKGFQPAEVDSSDTSLKVELRALSYDTSMGFFTGGNIGKASIKVIASRPQGKSYEKTYHGNREIRTAFVGSQETNANVVNGALNDSLDKIFADRELWNFLAQ